MSQLQDFQKISESMGKVKRAKLETYLNTFNKDFATVVYSEKEWKSFESWLNKNKS